MLKQGETQRCWGADEEVEIIIVGLTGEEQQKEKIKDLKKESVKETF